MESSEFYAMGLHMYNLGAGTTDIPYTELYYVSRLMIAEKAQSIITDIVARQVAIYVGAQSARMNQSIGISTTISMMGKF
jgi:hypothetical protein